MGTLAERMAAHYQTDANLELGPHLAHYMEEVVTNIHDRLEKTLSAPSGVRHDAFLQAVVASLRDRIDRHNVVAAD
jgi:hypothetical protein